MPGRRALLAATFGLAAVPARAERVVTDATGRGIAVPDAARERILAATDPERLERWHERAIVAAAHQRYC